MKKELQLFLIGSLVLGACSPIVAAAKGADTNTPDPTKVGFDPTLSPTPQPQTLEVVQQIYTEVAPTPAPEKVVAPPLIYLAQKDYSDELLKQNHSWEEVGCSILTFSMASGNDPYYYYYKMFVPYFESMGKDPKERITKNGGGAEDHIEVLTHVAGWSFEELTQGGASTEEVKARMQEKLNLGYRIIIKTKIINRQKGHYAVVIGFYDGGLILYDSLYGKDIHVPDSKIDEVNWEVYSAKPPKN